MKINNLLAAIMLAVCTLFAACDDSTDAVGISLTDDLDFLTITTDTFTVTSRSIVSDSVYARNTTGYLGKIRDPESGAYITCDFMAQFHTLDEYEFPAQDSIASLVDGLVAADSCHLRLFFTEFYGDTLAPMNMTMYEMATPMEEGVKYYSNFNPMDAGLVRTDGLVMNKTYTLCDLSIDEDTRYDEDAYTPNIRLNLNNEYTDAEGNTYNNYGTYIMRKYYEDPTNFKNSYNFIHNVCPGFYFQINEGLGSMAYVTVCQINVYFKYQSDSTLLGTSSFSATEEVLQTTRFANDDKKIDALASDNSCSYLKTPAGIFTELTLPVDDIMQGHENDTLNQAKVVIPRINNTVHTEYTLSVPETLLMIPKDSLYTFFENGDTPDYKHAFLGAYSSTYNYYPFNNISGMINYMYDNKQAGLATDDNWEANNPDWNKVVLVPVTVTTNSSSVIVKVVHDMSIASTKLIGGSENEYEPLQISVIYSKFSNE